jgi:hypothetical protein
MYVFEISQSTITSYFITTPIEHLKDVCFMTNTLFSICDIIIFIKAVVYKA